MSDRGGDKGLNAEQTRRGFLKMMGVGGACLALLGLRSCFPSPGIRATASRVRAGQAWTFRSRPDLSPPSVEVTERARGTAPGYLFAASKNGPGEEYPAQDGPMILDNDGQPVWLCPVRGEEKDAMDFKVQRYVESPSSPGGRAFIPGTARANT